MQATLCVMKNNQSQHFALTALFQRPVPRRDVVDHGGPSVRLVDNLPSLPLIHFSPAINFDAICHVVKDFVH
jgi:hypothetical protein